jgi:ankyrin repeat protein
MKTSLSQSPRPASPNLNLEQLRKRARELKKHLDGGSVSAAARIQRAVPARAQVSLETILRQGSRLSETQFVIAREAGFESWPKLRRALDVDRISTDQLAGLAVKAAVNGHVDQFRETLRRHPGLADDAPAVSLICFAPESVTHLQTEGINAALPPNGWTPLMYVLSSRFATDEASRQARRDLVSALIALGADVNTGNAELESVRGYRTALGAAVGLARDPEIVRMLLESGADINDGPTLYEGSAMWEAVRLEEIESLTLLLEADPPLWHKCHALPHALQGATADIAGLLLDHGADPDWNKVTWGFEGSSVTEAVVLGAPLSLLVRMIDAGARVDFEDRAGRTPLQLAVSLHRESHARALMDAGADQTRVRDVDRALGRCFAGGVMQDISGFSGVKSVDHVWLCRAIRSADGDTAIRLLAGGVNPDATDDDGMTALHLAAQSGNIEVCQCLLESGADVNARNYASDPPLDVALGLSDSDEIVALLRQYGAVGALPVMGLAEAFEAAADAVVAGDSQRLQALLNQFPDLVRARSTRPHRCTLFHYLGANGYESERQKTPANAVEIIQMLLNAGCDPNALCYTYRGGAGQSAFGLMTSSSHPREAGLMLAMAAAMVNGGAKVDPTYECLLGCYQSLQDTDTLTLEDPELAGLALIEAAMLGEHELVTALVRAGADVNARNGVNATALHQAAINGDQKLVELLLARGADPAIRDDTFNGRPSGWAYAGGHVDLGKKLAALESKAVD